MTANIQNQPYLARQRKFPVDDIKQLSTQVDIAYIDIANQVNQRTIGTFPLSNPVITGEQWYLQGSTQKQETLRQVYVATPEQLENGNIAHGINEGSITAFSRIYGTFTDGTIWYPLPYVDATDVTNQVSININPTDIVITQGAGFINQIIKMYIVLEWLSQI